MITPDELYVLYMCLEGFLFGTISVLCFNWYLAKKKVQLFSGLGIYSAIFAIYLQWASKESRTTIIFYALCLLYFLTTATFVIDLLFYTIGVSNISIR